MIHHIFSTLPSFKNLGDLKPGLNVLLAQKTEGATTKQTRNRAGKTSFVELVHFLLGADGRHVHQRPARLNGKIAGLLGRRARLQTQATGQRDHRAVVGAEFQLRVIDAETLAFCLVIKGRPQLSVGADAAGHHQLPQAGLLERLQ